MDITFVEGASCPRIVSGVELNTVEQAIIDRLHEFHTEAQRRVLEFIEQLKAQPRTHYSAIELMRLPAEERDRIVAEVFRLAENKDFKISEAYSEEPRVD